MKIRHSLQSTLSALTRTHFWCALLCILCGATSLVRAQSLPDLLVAPTRASLQWVASTDPKKQNNDFKMLAPGQTMRVPLPAGRLLRLWSTSSEPENLHLRLQNGATHDLLRDNRARVGKLSRKAYNFYPIQSTLSALRDLKNGAALFATNNSKQAAKWYYQTTVGAALPEKNETGVRSESRFQMAGNEAKTLNPKARAGLWTRLEIELPTVKADDALNAWRSLRLQARWKGEDKLGMDLPLLALSGQFWKAGTLQSAAAKFKGKTLTWQLPIPFGPDDKVWIFNGGAKKIECTTRLWEAASPAQSTLRPRLHALFGSTRTQKSQPIPILTANGEGAFVGLALDIRPVAEARRFSFAYLEGNETIIADGAKYEGTGTEDYFNSAWYFPDKPFVEEFGGLTFKNANPPQVSMVRWMLPDAVGFRRSLRFTLEHGRANNSDDLEYRWAAFWYQVPGGEWEVEDALRYGAAIDQSTSKNLQRSALVRRYILGTLAVMLLVGGVAALLSRRGKRSHKNGD